MSVTPQVASAWVPAQSCVTHGVRARKKQLGFLYIWKKMQVRSMLLRVLASGIILSPVVSFTTRHRELQCSACRGRPRGTGQALGDGAGRSSPAQGCWQRPERLQKLQVPHHHYLQACTTASEQLQHATLKCIAYRKGREVHLLITSLALMIGLSSYLQQML